MDSRGMHHARTNTTFVAITVVALGACGFNPAGQPSSEDDAMPALADATPSPDGCSACATADPGEPGGLEMTSSSVDLTAADDTTLPLTIYQPDGDGPFPVVVFHHGFQLTTALYASYGTHLASWGYVVVMPQMPSALIGGPTHRELAGYLGEVLDWIEARASATTGPLAGLVDPSRIGLAGHSMGGKISMLTATQDDRPRAIVGIDPVDAAGSPLASSAEDYPSVTPELMGEIAVPIAMIGELANATCTGFLCQPCAPAADNFHQYYEHADEAAVEIEIVGASHMSFIDDPACGLACSSCPAGTDDPSMSRALVRRYLTAFFNVELRGQTTYRAYFAGAEMSSDVAAGRVHSAYKNGL